MATHLELLKDPRWQRLRLEILSRDNFTCQKCGSTEKTLHVHHQYYVKGHMPWDYHPLLLVTICFECHEEEEYAKGQTDEFVSYTLGTQLLRCDIHQLLSHVASLVDMSVPYPSPCQTYRNKLKEVISFVDNEYEKIRSERIKGSAKIAKPVVATEPDEKQSSNN